MDVRDMREAAAELIGLATKGICAFIEGAAQLGLPPVVVGIVLLAVGGWLIWVAVARLLGPGDPDLEAVAKGFAAGLGCLIVGAIVFLC